MQGKAMNNKQRLQILLDGGVPDVPPHWELVFQIPREMFGIDPNNLSARAAADETVKAREKLARHIEASHRLIDECDWAVALPMNSYDPDMVRAAKDACGSRALVPGFEGEGVFWMPTGETMMDFAVRLYEAPGDLHRAARRKCDAAMAHYRRLADAGADFFVGTYDFGFNDQPFISPEKFAEFVTPYLAEIVACAHGLNKKILLHSDGCLNQILDQIHSTGIDGYQSVDPQGHMDIRAVREQYPDWLLMGNVACNMLQGADDASIRASVRYCMTHGGVGKRYIFSTSNCIFSGMPPESYRIMLDEYRRICRGRH